MDVGLFFSSFSNIFQWDVLLMVFLGAAGGTLLGALPGLTATMGVALLVPFTFGLPLTNSMGMLLGIYCGGMYGGSISAVLIRTPGTPSAAATVLDGYPMGQKGEANRALAMSLFASVCGGLIGAAIMTVFSPLISMAAMSFSTAEFFCLAVFGLSIIVSISGKSIAKGLMSAFFGLLLCTVGSDPISGYPRFIFGRMELYEGPPFIPTLIGLFAVSEVLSGVEKIIKSQKVESKIKNPFPSLADIKKCGPTIIRSAVVGCFIGAIPGAGGDIAAFVAYGTTKSISKYPEKFGTGVIEGIAAPEAANNGCSGGAMIPLLSLGVPGDSVTAVLLGAFIMQGLQPGPLMYKENLQDVYNVFCAMFAANFAVLILGVILMPFFSSIISIDKNVLLPCIMILSLVGSYAMRNSMFDVFLTITFGVVGYLLQKFNFPLSPILLALILGPMAESNLRRELVKSDGNIFVLFTRPISVVLLLLALGSLILAVYNQSKINKREAAAGEASDS